MAEKERVTKEKLLEIYKFVFPKIIKYFEDEIDLPDFDKKIGINTILNVEFKKSYNYHRIINLQCDYMNNSEYYKKYPKKIITFISIAFTTGRRIDQHKSQRKSFERYLEVNLNINDETVGRYNNDFDKISDKKYNVYEIEENINEINEWFSDNVKDVYKNYKLLKI
jgi:hypothetical protein